MTELEEMGPIDYVVLEWTGSQPDGTALPHLIDLVESGTVRILDLVFVTKAQDGSWAMLAIDELGDAFAAFNGATSGIIGESDIDEAMSAVEPGTSAAIIVWENRWAAPFAMAVRKNGGQMVASGRIPIQALLDAVDTEVAV
jgi:hypothetical protein